MMKFEKKIVGYIKCIILRMMYANFVINWPGQLVCKGGGVAPLSLTLKLLSTGHYTLVSKKLTQ